MTKIRNGVNLDNLEALIAAVKDNRYLSQVRFMARSEWKGGTKAEVTISELTAGGQNVAGPQRSFKVLVDEPPQLGGTDEAPDPVEYLAAGLCGCLTAGIASNAALFGTDLEKIEVSVEIDYDFIGLLGLDRSVPTSATELKYTVRIKGAPGASPEAVRKAKEIIDRKSPVANTIRHPIRVSTEIILEE
jgi:uncharacterized OsmC-like protein